MAIPYIFGNQTGIVSLSELDSNFSSFASTTNDTQGSSLVGHLPSSAGAVGTTVQSKLREFVSAFDFMTSAQIADVRNRTALIDVSVPLQAFFDACKGGRGYMPAGVYWKTVRITMDPHYCYNIEGAGWSINQPTLGTVIKDTLNVDGLFLDYVPSHVAGGPANWTPPSANSDERQYLAHFALKGPGGAPTPGTETINLEGVVTTIDKGNGIVLNWVNQLVLEDVQITGYQADGIFGYRCFSSQFYKLFVHQNGNNGIHLKQTSNAVRISKCVSLGNGMRPAAVSRYNILVDGGESLGPVIDGPCDVSYGGNSAPAVISIAAGTLLSIVVSAGVASINAIGHGYSVGNQISIKGATVAPGLNTIYAASVIAPVAANFFTIATSAPNGTYTDTFLAVAPYVVGVSFGTVTGGQIEAYSEDCTGPGMYIAADCKGIAVRGGYWQNNKILVDTGARGVTVANTNCVGINGGIYAPDPVGVILIENTNDASALPYVGGLPMTDNGSFAISGVYAGRGKGGELTNTGFGIGALYSADQSSNGNHSAAFGYLALNGMTTGFNNSGFGRGALTAVTTGFQITGVGNNAGNSLTSASDIISIGHNSSQLVTTGSVEINIGSSAGSKGTASATGGNNIHIGHFAGSNTLTTQNLRTYILGHSASGAFVGGAIDFIGIGHDVQSTGHPMGGANANPTTTVIGSANTTKFKPVGQLYLDAQNTISAAVALASTHKIAIVHNGVPYYLLAHN